jgi:hypothetical protein
MMRIARMASVTLLAITAALLLLFPLLLFAQDTAVVTDTAIVTPGTPSSWQDMASYAIMLALGLVTPYVVKLLEKLSPLLASQPALVKRTVVSMLTGAITMACAWLAQRYPAFPWNPEPLQGLVISALAFGSYSGDVAKKANGTAEEAKTIANGQQAPTG